MVPLVAPSCGPMYSMPVPSFLAISQPSSVGAPGLSIAPVGSVGTVGKYFSNTLAISGLTEDGSVRYFPYS